MPGPAPRPPVVIENLLPDPGLARRLVERHAPYWPVQRYVASAAEQRALSASARAPADGPVFRGDWAYDRPLVPGPWKAQAFRDEAAARLVDEHRDDLTLARVLDAFLADLRARDLAATLPADPLHDETFVGTLTAAYRQTPTVHPRGNAA